MDVNYVQVLLTAVGTAVPIIAMVSVSATRLVTRLALLEAEVKRLAELVEKQNGRIRSLEILTAKGGTYDH